MAGGLSFGTPYLLALCGQSSSRSQVIARSDPGDLRPGPVGFPVTCIRSLPGSRSVPPSRIHQSPQGSPGLPIIEVGQQ